MKLTHNRGPRAVIAAAVASLAVPAFAQSTGPAPANRVEIVGTTTKDYRAGNSNTATRTDTPISEIPYSVQVVNETLMQEQQAYRLEDVVRNVSGVRSETQIWSAAYEALKARGFELQPYRDGVRMLFLTVPLANAERVEFLKGPAAIQYGRVEPGGMVNVVTKKAQAQSLRAVGLELGSHGFKRATADLAGAVNEDKTVLARLNAEWLDKDSSVDHAFDTRTFFAPAVSWLPTASTRIDLAYERRDEKELGPTGIPALGKRPAPVPTSRFYSEPGLYNHFMADALNLKVSHQLNAQWTLRGGLGVLKGNYKYASIWSNELAADNTTLSRWGLASDFDHRNSKDGLVEAVGKFQALGVRHTLLMGLDHHQFDNDGNWSDQTPAPIDIHNPVYALDVAAFRAAAPTSFWTRTDQWTGVYLQDQIQLSQQLDLLIGVRHDRTNMRSGYSGVSLDDAAVVAIAKTERKSSPTVGLTYKLQPGMALYASYASGFGGPASTSLTKSGAFVEPETSAQLEAGAKLDLLDDRLSATVAVYNLRKKNVATTDPTDNRFVIATGEVRSRGLEIDVSGKLGAQWSIQTNYAYNDIVVTRSNNGDEGQRLANAPRHTTNLWLKWAAPGDWAPGLSLGGGFSAASASKGDNAGSFQLPGYGRVDAYAAYRFKLAGSDTNLQLNVNNLFDRTYYPSAQGRAAVLPGEPRTVTASMRVVF